MNELTEIKSIIDKCPKHFAKMIQKRKPLLDWVLGNTMVVDASPASMIYSAINAESNICSNGNVKRYKSITDGFGFCGTAGKCKCANESVSEKVAEAKANRTPIQIRLENDKRVQTNTDRYGVENTGQTLLAKQQHRRVYEDQAEVARITAQVKKTKLLKHGDENFNNRTKSIVTNLQRYGVPNTWSLTECKQNPNITLLKCKAWLTEAYKSSMTVEDLASELGVHKQTVYYYLGYHQLREPYKSTFEHEIAAFLRSNGISNIVTNKRNIIGKELDIYLPDYQLAIEYNGEYWHHIDIPHITRTYHYDKFIECEKKGITLFTIFGNSWKNNKDSWKAKILNRINLSAKRVYARKCEIVDLSTETANDFLKRHHIQQGCVSQYRYGLVYAGELVAVMTFSKSRCGIGTHRSTDTYELVRYATSMCVVGGASKLLANFVKNHNALKVISYSDNQYSIGAMYKILGFRMERETKGGYWYYDPVSKVSYHRYNFTKHKLVEQGFDVNKSESEIMRDRGFLRIFDCGSRTWVYSTPENDESTDKYNYENQRTP